MDITPSESRRRSRQRSQPILMKDDRPPYTITEAARRLNISDTAARNAMLQEELDGFKIGGSWRITPASVDRKLAGGRVR